MVLIVKNVPVKKKNATKFKYFSMFISVERQDQNIWFLHAVI